MDDWSEPFETLKQILRSVRDPKALDGHPWTRSLLVQETVAAFPHLQMAGPGQRLISTLARLFPQMQPSAPPRRGKRLDPRWGEFGLLAALYFTPFNHGRPYPTSLLDAWGRIDEAILYFVYGRPAEALHPEEIEKYRLVGDDLEYGSTSTLSDWHRKGLQRFTSILLDQESFLARTQSKPSVLLGGPQARTTPPVSSRGMARAKARLLWFSLAGLLLLLFGWGAFKGWQIYRKGQLVYLDTIVLRETLDGEMGIESLDAAIPRLSSTQEDLASLKEEAQPLLWLASRLGWVPVHGGDLAAAPQLMETADRLLNAALLASQAAGPLLEETGSGTSSYDPASLTFLLVQARPQLQQAQAELEQALAARESLEAVALSPRLRSLVVDDLDPLLDLAGDGLSLAIALPDMMGAGSAGPRTYLLLAQNEDELRPTGGFITSVGNLVVHNGGVISLEFEDMGEQEDWSRPYPQAPWQLQEYMNSRVLILRDANWFADFPTSARWAEYLYAYTHDHSVDGVLAFDQRFLVMLLEEIGPLNVEGAPYPINAGNVVGYMRQAKSMPDAADPSSRKAFIGRIGEAVLRDLIGGGEHDWRGIAEVLSRALEERHLLLQFDDPSLAALAGKHGWDYAVRPVEGDGLLVTDTNIGFNKTNAVVTTSLEYIVDLEDLSAPESLLTVTHSNHSSGDVPCIQWNGGGQISNERYYPIDRCYWNYLRVYKQAGTVLLESTPHAVPAEWMLLGKPVPARVDDLHEKLSGIQGFGTLLVLPAGETLNTSFHFALPPGLFPAGSTSNSVTYRLRVQKQPGTLAVPLTIRVHLPPGAILISTNLDATQEGQTLLLQTDLRRDVDLEVVFTLP